MIFLRCLMIVALAQLLTSGAHAQTTVTLGETNILGYGDNGNAGYVTAEGPYNLPQQATVDSLSLWATTARGELILGIYTSGPNNNCAGGSLMAHTATFTTHPNSWNTAKPSASTTLPAGNYCVAYMPSSNSLGFRKGVTSGIYGAYASERFGAMPGTFPANATTGDQFHWSLYATLTTIPTGPPTLTVTFQPPNPSVSATAAIGSVVATAVPTWSNGAPFTGACSFASPYFSDNGMFSLGGSDNCEILVGASLQSEGGTVQDVTVQASQ
jgi:hypothetical protein